VFKVALVPALAAALLAPLVAAHPAAALGSDADLSVSQLAAQLKHDDTDAATALDAINALQQPAGGDLVVRLDQPLRLQHQQLAFRIAARSEQTDIYLLAGDPATERAVEAELPDALAAQVRDAAGALRAIWRLAEVDDITNIHPHFVRDYKASLPVPSLVGFYQQAAGHYGMDWTYLAAINYVETDFGRVLGPSVTGAEGPMQFEPATWTEYGTGSVMNPSDAIAAAARYLNSNGAPGQMAQAIYAYNPTWDYVEGVSRYAAVIRRDPSWYQRLYYWSTAEPGQPTLNVPLG
jgi:transglycosylase-like protein with SLT domain